MNECLQCQKTFEGEPGFCLKCLDKREQIQKENANERARYGGYDEALGGTKVEMADANIQDGAGKVVLAHIGLIASVIMILFFAPYVLYVKGISRGFFGGLVLWSMIGKYSLPVVLRCHQKRQQG